jgi:hypothetical protein
VELGDDGLPERVPRAAQHDRVADHSRLVVEHAPAPVIPGLAQGRP